MVLFKDIHKKVDDLHGKDWPHEHKYEIENNWKSGGFSFKNKVCVGGSWVLPTFALTGPADAGSKAAAFKAPVSHHEISYDTKSFQFTAKIDSEGKVSDDFKFKDLGVAGASATLKTAYSARSAVAVEAQTEYTGEGHHFFLSANPAKQSFVVANVYEAHKQATIGAELSGPLAPISGFTGYKASFAGVFSNANKDGVFGAKISHELGSSQTAVQAYVNLIQGKSDVAVNVSHVLGDEKDAVKLAFVGKHQFDKDLSFKFSANDSMDFKAALYHKLSPSVTSSFGAAYKNGSKDGDNVKVGVKLAFSG